jgi:type III restriction enzyme
LVDHKSATDHEDAETHGKKYRRIEAVSKINDKLRVLDLTLPSVRKAVLEMSSAQVLYESSHATDY